MTTRITVLSLAVFLALGGGAALAQESTGGAASYDSGFGVGIEAMLSGPKGPAFVYQAANFHVDAILAFDSGVDDNILDFNDGTDHVEVGGRFFYEIHSGEISDFSLGGGLGIHDHNPPGPDDSQLDVSVEGAMQIRAFIVPNVAIHATAGLTIEFNDNGPGNNDDVDFAFIGQPMAAFGITYFFF